jgi:hypothetical protein
MRYVFEVGFGGGKSFANLCFLSPFFAIFAPTNNDDDYEL